MLERRGLLPLVVAVLLAVSASQSSAQEPPALSDNDYESGWSLRFYAAAIDFDHSSEGLNRPGGRVGYTIDTGGGLGLNAEYRFARRFGVDLGLLAGAGVGIEASTLRSGSQNWVTYDEVSFTPLTAGVDIHLTPGRRVDVRVCPMVAWVNYGSYAVATSFGGTTFTSVEVDNDLAPGIALGLGVPFGDKDWSFQANLMYLNTDLNGTGSNGVRVDSGYDATAFGVGFGYRF